MCSTRENVNRGGFLSWQLYMLVINIETQTIQRTVPKRTRELIESKRKYSLKRSKRDSWLCNERDAAPKIHESLRHLVKREAPLQNCIGPKFLNISAVVSYCIFPSRYGAKWTKIKRNSNILKWIKIHRIFIRAPIFRVYCFFDPAESDFGTCHAFNLADASIF